MSIRQRVICVGDSLVMGAWDTKGGWVDRLKQSMNCRYVDTNGDDRVQVYNLGVGSETSETLLLRLDAELKARASSSWPITVVIGIGKNDSRIVGGKPLVGLDDFEKNIKKITEVVRKYTTKIVFVEPLPVRCEEVEFKGTFYRSSLIALYANKLQEVTDGLDVELVGLKDDFMKNTAENMYAADGLHLNDRGHEFVFMKIRLIIDNMIGVTR